MGIKEKITGIKGKVKAKKEEIERKKRLEKSVEEKIQRKELEPLMRKYGLSYEEAKIYAKKLEKERKKKERREKLKKAVKSAAKSLHEYGEKQRRTLIENDISHTLTPRRDPFDFSDLDGMFGFSWLNEQKGKKGRKKKDPLDDFDFGFGSEKAEELEKMLRL